MILCDGCGREIETSGYVCSKHHKHFCYICARNDDHKRIDATQVHGCLKKIRTLGIKRGEDVEEYDCILEPYVVN